MNTKIQKLKENYKFCISKEIQKIIEKTEDQKIVINKIYQYFNNDNQISSIKIKEISYEKFNLKFLVSIDFFDKIFDNILFIEHMNIYVLEQLYKDLLNNA